MIEGIGHVKSERGRDVRRARDDGARAWRRGRSLARRGEHREALVCFEEAEEILLTVELRPQALRVMRGRMHSLEMMGRYRDAIEVADRCRSLLLPSDGERERARLDVQEANIRHLLHDRERAIALYRGARRVFERRGDTVMAARIDVSLANILTYGGELREAEAIYRRSRGVLRDAGKALRVGIVDSNLGLNLAFQGRYLEAVRAHHRSRDAFDRLGAGDRVAMVDLNLSDLYLELNLFEEADLSSRRALEAFRRAGQDHGLALASLNRYFVERRVGGGLTSGDRDAGMLLERAREIFRAQGSEVWAAVTEMHQAAVLLSAGRIDDARSRAESAHGTLREHGVVSYACHARLLVARAWEAGGDLAAADRQYGDVVGEAETAGVDELKARALHGRGRIEERTGRESAAIQSYAEAVDTIETVRNRLRLDDFRTSFIEDRMGVYEDAIRLHLDRGEMWDALRYVERSRSNALLDLLSEHVRLGPPRGRATEGQDAPRARLSARRLELNRLYLRSRELEQSPDVEARAEREGVIRMIREVEGDCGRQWRGIAIEQAGTDAPGGGPGLSRLDPVGVLASLEPGTVVLEYAAIGDEILLFVLDRGTGTVIRGLGSMREIEASLGEWKEEMADIACLDPEFVRENGEALAAPALALLRAWDDRLLTPARDRLGEADTLLVLPHGALHHLPFHAFSNGGEFAIERWNILQAPGLHVYDLCRRRERGRGGNPLLVATREEELHFVEEEIHAIAGLYPGAETLRDEAATVDAFLSHAGRASHIHLSCHGRYRRDNPLFSSLRLHDGELTAHDICGLELACDLVVLSACETGVSDVRPGDELMGLCRSFFLAGTPSLVVSLWPVSDRSTRGLMEYFYAAIRDGEPASRALRRAQCRLMAEWPHPYYWAPFIAIGRD